MFLIIAALSTNACYGKPPRQVTGRPLRPLILVFADVTSSLTAEEINSAAAALTDLYVRAPEGAEIRVLPMKPNMDLATLVSRAEMPFRTNNGNAAIWRDIAERENAAHSAWAALIAPDALLPRTAAASCLVGALRRAADELAPGDAARPTEVVLITDMIEECAQSLGGTKILMLSHPHLNREIEAARAIVGTLADLRKASVTMIYPAAAHTADVPHPPTAELREFWRLVLSHCNVGDVRFMTNSDAFHPEWKSVRTLLPKNRQNDPVPSHFRATGKN
jgi:hypothetical protein